MKSLKLLLIFIFIGVIFISFNPYGRLIFSEGPIYTLEGMSLIDREYGFFKQYVPFLAFDNKKASLKNKESFSFLMGAGERLVDSDNEDTDLVLAAAAFRKWQNGIDDPSLELGLKEAINKLSGKWTDYKEILGQKTLRDRKLKFESSGWNFNTQSRSKTYQAVVFVDLDGDKLNELIVGSFEDGLEVFRVSDSGVWNLTWSDSRYRIHSISPGDFDNDGRIDLLCTQLMGGVKVFKNLGELKFKEVSKELGIRDSVFDIPFNATWVDLNQDGVLEVILTGFPVSEIFGGFLPSRILGFSGGSYVDQTRQWLPDGVLEEINVTSIEPGDVDNDGDLDLFVSSINFGKSMLLINNGKGKLVRSKQEFLLPGVFGFFGDFNQDGRLDIFHGGISHSVLFPGKSFETNKEIQQASTSRIYIQNESGSFNPAFLNYQNRPSHITAASYQDINGDGCPEVFEGGGGMFPLSFESAYMLKGERNEDGLCEMDLKSPVLISKRMASIHGLVTQIDSAQKVSVYYGEGGFWPVSAGNFYRVWKEEKNLEFIKLIFQPGNGHSGALGVRSELHFVSNEGVQSVRYEHVGSKMGLGFKGFESSLFYPKGWRINKIVVSWPGGGRSEVNAPFESNKLVIREL